MARPLVGSALAYFIVYTFLVARAVALPARQSTIATGKPIFSGPRRTISSPPARPRWRRGGCNWSGLWAVPLTAGADLPDVSHLQGPCAAASRPSGTARAHRICTSRPSKRWRAPSTRKIRWATRTSSACSSTPAGSPTRSGFPREEVQAIKTAALLHDIGKLAIPEHILSKPGPLTPEEFQKVRIHPQGRRGNHRRRSVSVSGRAADSLPPRTVGRQRLSERAGGRGHSDRRADSFGRRLLRRGDVGAALSLRAQPRRRRGSPASTKPDARWIRHWSRCSSRNCRQLDCRLRSRRSPKRASPLEASASSASDPAAAAADRRATAFHNIGLAHREIYALYEIAQSMGTSLGVAGTMDADLIEAEQDHSVVGLCALPAAAGSGRAALPLCRRRRCAAPDRHHEFASARACRDGWRAIAACSSTSARASSSRRPASNRTAALHSAIVCPLYLGDVFIGSLALFHTEANRYNDDHRRLITQRRRTGRRRDSQLHRVRAGAGGFADRSADVAAQPPIAVRARHPRAGARRAPRERAGDDRARHRRVQADQRHLRVTTSETRRCARSPTSCATRCANTTCASASPATSSSS